MNDPQLIFSRGELYVTGTWQPPDHSTIVECKVHLEPDTRLDLRGHRGMILSMVECGANAGVLYDDDSVIFRNFFDSKDMALIYEAP